MKTTCPPISCPANGELHYSNGVQIGSVATLICNDHFQLSGLSSSACVATSTNPVWRGALGQCVRSTPIQIHVCENSVATLTCPAGTYISIVAGTVIYGRTQNDLCPYPGFLRGLIFACPGCRGSNAQVNAEFRVRSDCQYRQTCSFTVGNGMFGDPCLLVYKYLQLSYTCQAGYVAETCEHGSVDMKCPPGFVIEVTSGFYGRQQDNYCPGIKSDNVNCPAGANTLNTFHTKCDGKNECILPAENAVFSDPCYGTYKYLRTSYNCVV